ncbi:MAG: peptidase M1 [Gemmataceae bacterium]
MSEDLNPLALLKGLADPARLLLHPQARGQGVRVAIVDTGVDRVALAQTLPARTGQHLVAEALLFDRHGQPRSAGDLFSAPHGTTVAHIVLLLAPEAELYSADVFAGAGTASLEAVIAALDYARSHWRCHLVNLSLGITEEQLQLPARRRELVRAIEACYYQDVLVVAAAHNMHPIVRSYPAVYSAPLVSVDKGPFEQAMEFAYVLREQIEFQAHARGYLGPFADTPATSWAAAHLTGLIARLLSLQPGLKPFEVKTLLYWMSQTRRRWAEHKDPSG